MLGRQYTAANQYRYGFNGQEKDNEVNGSGNELDFGDREYDARLGRWFNVDPLSHKYPYYSPYSAFANNPIWYRDEEGHENIVYLVYLPNKDNKITKQDAQAMADKANENYRTLGVNTLVVMVDKSVTGGQDFQISKIDETDAVAVIGTVKDVTNYLKKQGEGEFLEGWQGGVAGNPEISQNERKFDKKGNLVSYAGGGKVIAIDVNGIQQYGDLYGWTKEEAGGQIINHGSGHNAEKDNELKHDGNGIMMDAKARQYTTEKSDKDYKTITSKERNSKLIKHLKERFGTKTAKVNYPKGPSVRQTSKF